MRIGKGTTQRFSSVFIDNCSEVTLNWAANLVIMKSERALRATNKEQLKLVKLTSQE